MQQNIFGGSFGAPVVKENSASSSSTTRAPARRVAILPAPSSATSIPYIPAADRSSAAAIEADCGIPSIDPVALALLQAKSNQFGGCRRRLSVSRAPTPSARPPAAPYPSSPASRASTTMTNSLPIGTKSSTAVATNSPRAPSIPILSTFLPFGAGGLQASLGAAAASTDLNFPYLLPLRGRFFSIGRKRTSFLRRW